jgi:hypothetical protein
VSTHAVTQPGLLHLEDVISRYDIGELVRYWPVSDGDRRYFLRTHQCARKREFVLSIIEQKDSPSGAYVMLLDNCDSASLPVVVRNHAGNPYETLDGNLVLLTHATPCRSPRL